MLRPRLVEGGLPYEREIRVAVAPMHAASRFFGKNWKWVAGTVAIPLIVWVAKKSGLDDAALAQLRALLGNG